MKKIGCMSPVRGMRDFIGPDAQTFHAIVDQLQRVVHRYGFAPIETPLVEFTSLFVRSLGDTSDVVDKEMFTFSDRSGQSVSLRPEGTASAVRALITNKLTQTLPQKWSYYGPMFRYDRPQKGRYRQFYQFGVEDLGASGPLSDVEAVAMAWEGVRSLGMDKATLYINSIGDATTRADYRAKLVAYFETYKNDLSEDSQRRLPTNPLRILDSKDTKDRDIVQGAPQISDSFTPEAARFFDRVKEGLAALGLMFTLDPCLVRGLDYYDHTTFEIKAPVGEGSTPLAVVGGGRYNGLVEQMGGPSVPAVGWAAGLDRLMLAVNSPTSQTPPVAVLFVGEAEAVAALRLAGHLRDVVHNPVLTPSDGNLAKRMKMSDRSGALCVFLIGEDELKDGRVKVKFLRATGEFAEGTECILSSDELATWATHHLLPAHQ